MALNHLDERHLQITELLGQAQKSAYIEKQCSSHRLATRLCATRSAEESSTLLYLLSFSSFNRAIHRCESLTFIFRGT